jgi:hypothetical protein
MSDASAFCETAFFRCENCDAFYHVVKMRAGPRARHHDLCCLKCSAAFQGHDGRFAFKYILLRQTVGPQKRRRLMNSSD